LQCVRQHRDAQPNSRWRGWARPTVPILSLKRVGNIATLGATVLKASDNAYETGSGGRYRDAVHQLTNAKK
jgi:hypothetical protein